MIRINDLCFGYPDADRLSLDHVKLQIPKQSLFGLLGPNGAGKTSLLSILGGLLPCPQDCILIEQQDLHSNPANKKIALVPQEYAFYLQLSILENLTFFANLLGINKCDISNRINSVIHTCGLEERLQQKSANLSGGLKRRLNLAISLLGDPSILMLDEPTVGIDPHSRHFILETIKTLNQQGTTIVYTSHYMDEVESLCDQIAIIDQGKILVQGSLQELLRRGNNETLRIELKHPLGEEQLNNLGLEGNCRGKSLIIPLENSTDIPPLLHRLNDHKLEYSTLHYGLNNLEELFLDLTQRSLRD